MSMIKPIRLDSSIGIGIVETLRLLDSSRTKC